jgi:SOUL heme-binding protein
LDFAIIEPMKKRVLLLGILGLAALMAARAEAASKVEEPKFKIVEDHDHIQIREYDPMVIAEVELSGTEQSVLDKGFRILAGYIFGRNLPASGRREKIAMTSPVSAQSKAKGDKIPMTAPVTTQSSGSVWKVRFTMPAGRTLKNLPKPEDDRIELIEVPPKRVAVIRFAGFGSEETMNRKAKELRDFLDRFHFKTEGEPVYAYYNPPWTLPFLRRNEVQIAVIN